MNVFSELYESFNYDEKTVKFLSASIGVAPETLPGCLAILLNHTLTQSYGVPEVTSQFICKKASPSIVKLSGSQDDNLFVSVSIIDKAFCVINTASDVDECFALEDLSDIDIKDLIQAIGIGITTDIINLKAILVKIILPYLEAKAQDLRQTSGT